jgi:excisionase family DNA binding protein
MEPNMAQIESIAPKPGLLNQLLKNADLLTNDQAAAYLGVTPRTLEVWRCTKRHNIPYIKVGRLVKYRQNALDSWLIARTIGEIVGVA